MTSIIKNPGDSPVRYSEDHKAGTHKRIVEEASQRFRRDGIGATGLQPLMKALGLTHGGFYAHFKSKDDLVEQALRAATEDINPAARKAFREPGGLPNFIDLYLSSEHRANPAQGCPLPTMSAELGQRGQPSATTDAFLTARLAQLDEALPEDHHEHHAIGMFATLVGALMLSRSVEDPQLSERLLEGARSWLKHQIVSGESQE